MVNTSLENSEQPQVRNSFASTDTGLMLLVPYSITYV